MGFWDFFKKKKPPTEVENEEISRDELGKWLSEQLAEMEQQEKDFLDRVNNRIDGLISELKSAASVLEEVDIASKKAEEKLKFIAEENRKNYLEYVRDLVSKLQSLEVEIDVSKGVNPIFSDFEKRSKLSYQKVNIFVGKELAAINDSIKRFFKNLETLLRSNESFIQKAKVIRSVEEKFGELGKIEKALSDIKKTVDVNSVKVDSLKGLLGSKNHEIQEIQKSEKFIEESKKRQELESMTQEQKKLIERLRGLLDFKSLANFYHSFQDQMKIIKEYRDNFSKRFSESGGEDLFELLVESKLGSAEVLELVEQIRKNNPDKIELGETGSEAIESEIEKILSEIEALNSRSSAEEKRAEKLGVHTNSVLESVKSELVKLNVELVGV